MIFPTSVSRAGKFVYSAWTFFFFRFSTMEKIDIFKMTISCSKSMYRLKSMNIYIILLLTVLARLILFSNKNMKIKVQVIEPVNRFRSNTILHSLLYLPSVLACVDFPVLSTPSITISAPRFIFRLYNIFSLL